MESLDAFARESLTLLEARALRRRLEPTERLGAGLVRRGEKTLVSFSCNDYLGLAAHPKVVAAATQALERFGAGAGASRLVTGDNPLLRALEARLARHRGQEGALVFGSGYLANLAVPPALVGEGDVILMDELCHASMLAGAKLTGARTLRFRHNDLDHLTRRLELEGGDGRRLIMSERVFSMDGDLAPAAGLQALAELHDAWLLLDDAHGLGVLPAGAPLAPLEIGTLSKALGGYGGYVAASAPVVDFLTSRARSFVYSTGLPPASAAAALAALDLLETEPERGLRPLLLARRFTEALGLPRAESAIVPLVLFEAERALRFSAALAAEGFLVVAIRPPTVPAGTARLRFAFSAAHAEEDVDRLARCVQKLREPQP
jgi:8-amino-7-oxononanoate synthase